jgi:ElaB/YqjD/DUF883 family membrane-anchored ribosome-binding protein
MFTHHRMDRSAQALNNDLRAVVHDTQSLLEATAHESSRAVRRARHHAARSLRHARRAMGTEHLVAQTRHAIEGGDAYVRGHAWSFITAAAAVGLAVGLLLNVRR